MAWGVLVAPDVVLTPGPVEPLQEPGALVDVLVPPLPGEASTQVERLGCDRVDVVSVAGHAGAIGRLHLSRRARRSPFEGAPSAAGDLARLLAQQAGVWAALERIRAVPEGVPALSAAELLGDVSAGEPAGQAPVVQFRRFGEDPVRGDVIPAATDAVRGLCCLLGLPCCKKNTTGESEDGTSTD